MDSSTIGWIGSSYFAGWTISCPIIPVLSDKYGRKWIALTCVFFQLICLMVMIYSTEISLTIAMSFLNGFLCSGRCSVVFVYMSEFLTPHYTNTASLVFNFVDGSTCLWMSIWLEFINKHWKYLPYVGVVENALAFLLIIALIPESPLWLLKTGKIEKAKMVLLKITGSAGSQQFSRTEQLINDLDSINVTGLKINKTASRS